MTIQMSVGAFSICQHVAAIVVVASTVTVLYKKYQAAPVTKYGLPLPPGPPACSFWEVALPTSK